MNRPRVTHEQAINAIIELARYTGWRTFGVRPGRTEKGWRTCYVGDGHGYPDLTLFHERRGIILFVEVKVGQDKMRPEQQVWADFFRRFFDHVPSEIYRLVDYQVWRWDNPQVRAGAETVLKGE